MDDDTHEAETDPGRLTAREERIASRVQAELLDTVAAPLCAALQPLVALIVDYAIHAALEAFEAEGACSFEFHRSVPDFRDNGICFFCGEHRDRHRVEPICEPLGDEELERRANQVRQDLIVYERENPGEIAAMKLGRSW